MNELTTRGGERTLEGMSVQYVGHFLFQWFFLIKEIDKHFSSPPLASRPLSSAPLETTWWIFCQRFISLCFTKTWGVGRGVGRRGSNRTDPCLLHLVPRSVEYPSWDWRESRDFDELSHILQESKKLGKALESLSRSEWPHLGRVHACVRR